MTIYLGFDISKNFIDCCFNFNNTFDYFQISNNSNGFNELLIYINNKNLNLSDINSCCEATGVYWVNLANFLYINKIKISVVNPIMINHYAKSRMQRVKTDKRDSFLISEFCRINKPLNWVPPSIEQQQFKILNRRLEQLNHLLVIEKNRCHVADELISDSIQSIINSINEQIDLIKSKMIYISNQNSIIKNQLDLLMTIPGVGLSTAFWLLSIDYHKFPTSKHLLSYLGLTPIIKESGISIRGRAKLSRMGDKSIRKALYIPARVACTRSKIWRDWFDDKVKSGKPIKQIYVLMMKKIVVYSYTILKTGKPFNENLHKRLDL